MEFEGFGYRARTFAGLPLPVSLDDRDPDIYVELVSGGTYVATFYTLERVQYAMDKLQGSGQLLGGRYFHDPSFVIVRSMDLETIRAVIDDMVAAGHIFTVFQKCTDD